MDIDPRKPATAITLVDCFEECCPSVAAHRLLPAARFRPCLSVFTVAARARLSFPVGAASSYTVVECYE